MIKYNLLSISLFILIFGVYSCSEKSPDTIRIGILSGPSEISFMKMMEEHDIIDGKKVEIIIKTEPQQIQALMIQKKLDFAVLPTVMAANLYNKGVKYKMLACPIWGTMYILTNNPRILSINDLKNQTISVFGQGITPDILLQNLLKYKNIENVKIDYTFTSNVDLAQALLQKRVENAVISEPLVSVLLSKEKNIKNISVLTCENIIDNSDINIFVQTAFLVNNTYYNKYPEIVKSICDKYSQSCNFISEEPEKAAQLAVKLKILPDIQTAKISLPLCNIQYVSAFTIEHELIHYLNLFLIYDPASIGGKIPDNDFVIKKF